MLTYVKLLWWPVFGIFCDNWLQLNQFFSFLVLIRTELSVLCLYLCELFYFMKGVSKSTGTVTVTLYELILFF